MYLPIYLYLSKYIYIYICIYENCTFYTHLKNIKNIKIIYIYIYICNISFGLFLFIFDFSKIGAASPPKKALPTECHMAKKKP